MHNHNKCNKAVHKLHTASPQEDTMAFIKVLQVPWQRVDESVALLMNAEAQLLLLLNAVRAVSQAAGSTLGQAVLIAAWSPTPMPAYRKTT